MRIAEIAGGLKKALMRAGVAVWRQKAHTPSFDLTNLHARDIVFVEFVYIGKGNMKVFRESLKFLLL